MFTRKAQNLFPCDWLRSGILSFYPDQGRIAFYLQKNWSFSDVLCVISKWYVEINFGVKTARYLCLSLTSVFPKCQRFWRSLLWKSSTTFFCRTWPQGLLWLCCSSHCNVQFASKRLTFRAHRNWHFLPSQNFQSQVSIDLARSTSNLILPPAVYCCIFLDEAQVYYIPSWCSVFE